MSEQEAKNRAGFWARVAIGLVGAALIATMVAGGLNVASSQTDSGEKTAEMKQRIGPLGGAMGHRGGKGFGHHGMGPAIHGEFVVKDADGEGYRTMATQKGEVTSVSNTSIAVKSEDGFTRTYAVDEKTMVNAGRDGIGDVKDGHQVHVMAQVAEGKARALNIMDRTNIEKLMKGRRPQPPVPDGPGPQ